MAEITLKGNKIQTIGNLPKIGTQAPNFVLTKTDLSDVTPENYAGKKIVLNIFPSIDTPVCATSVRQFNTKASSLENTVVLCISKDLPFAHARFCTTEGLNNVVALSQMKNEDFGKDYGLTITTGPLTGLLARAIVVLNEKREVVYTELVPEIAQEPDYNQALKSI